MKFAKRCRHCERTFTVDQAALEPLSQSERLLCEKEGLDWSRMKKVTCSECGIPSLVQEAELRPLSLGEDADATLTDLAARVRAAASNAFMEPGPGFSEDRRTIIASWLENLARNLEEAALVARRGQDRNGTMMSHHQLAASLQRLRGEYEKGLARLDEVCGRGVHDAIAGILEATGRWAESRGRTDLAEEVPHTKSRSSTPAGGGDHLRESGRIRFDWMSRSHRWPQDCVCCAATSDASIDVAGEFDLQPVIDKGFLDKNTLTEAVTKRGFETVDVGGQLCVTLKAPYCKRCRTHDSRRTTGNVVIGCAFAPLGFLLLGLVIILVVFPFTKDGPAELRSMASDPAAWRRLAGFVLPLLGVVALGVVIRRSARGGLECAGPFGSAVRWVSEDSSGLTSFLLFANLDYASAFRDANAIEDEQHSAARKPPDARPGPAAEPEKEAS